jgi:hypothetical protein
MINFKTWLVIILAIFLGITNNAIAHTAEEQEYLTTLAKRTERTYFPPVDTYITKSTVAFILKSDGKVSDIHVISVPRYRNTKDPDILAGKALTFAIKHAAPFAPPPIILHCPVKIQMTFNMTPRTSTIISATAFKQNEQVSGSWISK